MENVKKEHREFWSHFPKKISKALVKYVTGTVLKSSRYLFVWLDGTQQYGYCTHCRKEYVVGVEGHYLKHNKETLCLNSKCKSVVMVKSEYRGRTNLKNDAYFVWYEKSRVNPSAIVARCIHVLRDYSGDYRKVETEYRTVSAYLFEPSQGEIPGRARQLRLENAQVSGSYLEQWREKRKVNSDFTSRACNWGWQHKNFFVSHKNIEDTVEGTPFQYSTWFKFQDEDTGDLVRFFALAAKYPCVEYLSKMGLRSFVVAGIRGYGSHGAINWKGQTVEKVLRLTKPEIRAMCTAGIDIEPDILKSYQILKRAGVSVTFNQAALLKSILVDGHYSGVFNKILPDELFVKKIKYALKQFNREDSRYRRVSDVITDWHDYLEECRELGMPCKDHVHFPNNLQKAHQNTTEKVMVKSDASLNVLIAKRLPELNKKYCFEHGDFFVRPAFDSIELFREGKALNHCVGRYSKDYADGKNDLLVIRKVSEPETPFYTMEIRGGRITQYRSFDNKSEVMTKEVDAFVEAFKMEKLATKKSKNKMLKPNERLEVAV